MTNQLELGFENDVFISYAHLDNQPLPFPPGQQGWVFIFSESLNYFLSRYLGRKARIWIDNRLDGNDVFSDEILQRLLGAAVLISIISERYVQSEWCLRELREFCRAAEARECFCSDNKMRVYKVMKTPVALEQHPQEIQGLIGYDFFRIIDESSGKFEEYLPELGEEFLKNFYQKIADISQQITIFLKRLQNFSNCCINNIVYSLEIKTLPMTKTAVSQIEDDKNNRKKEKIYLAQTTSDLLVEHDKIRRELEYRGYIVLPDRALPLKAPDLQVAVLEHMQDCKLSIHLIGDRYGLIPEGEELSVVELQSKIATKLSQQNPEFSSLVWMPEKLQPPEPRQKEFILSVQNALEIVQSSFEEFKTIILDKLNSPINEPSAEEASVRGIYLICDQLDLDAVEPLYTELVNQNFDVILPRFDGDEAQVRQTHQDNLLNCNQIIIYWGEVKELWIQKKLSDLQKISGYGKSIPLQKQAIYVDGPETRQKQRFQNQQRESIAIINDKDALAAFLNQEGE